MAKLKYPDKTRKISDKPINPHFLFDHPTSPLPVWEGVYNSTPKNMDMALYCMYAYKKSAIKQMMQMHSHLGLKEILKMKFTSIDNLQAVIPTNPKRTDSIYFVNDKEIGFVKGYAIATNLSGHVEDPDNIKYNVALIEFENVIEDGNPLNATRWQRPKIRTLSMYDENFILTKECEIVTLEELEDYMIYWDCAQEVMTDQKDLEPVEL